MDLVKLWVYPSMCLKEKSPSSLLNIFKELHKDVGDKLHMVYFRRNKKENVSHVTSLAVEDVTGITRTKG